MCGRFTLTAPAKQVAELLDLASNPPTAPRYNIAPSQLIGAVRLDRDTGQRSFVLLRWGLVPRWAKEPAAGNRMINARAETVAEKPAYREALSCRRCLIPADGFYEWQRKGVKKQPFLIRLPSHAAFAFAGLWERWQAAGMAPIESCTILTTQASRALEPIHDRMPVIVEPDQYEQWLQTGARCLERLLKEILQGSPGQQLEALPVGPRVNNPRHDDPQCLLRVPPHSAIGPSVPTR